MDGGVWDDVGNPGDSPGGNCITHKEADALIADYRGLVEEIDLEFSSDGHLAAFTARTEAAPTHIRCRLAPFSFPFPFLFLSHVEQAG